MIFLGLIIIGLCFGSFVNALVWRLQKQIKTPKKTNLLTHKNQYSILTGRSMCPNCHHELAIKDLVPVISWILLKGHCRYCGKSILWDSPLSELLVPLLFVVSYIWWPLGFQGVGLFDFVLWLVFLIAFVALGIYDIRWFLLPDKIVYPIIILGLFELIINATVFSGGEHLIIQTFWSVTTIAGLFYVLHVVSKGTWIGFGDVKLAILLGILAGNPLMSVGVIFLASVLGSAVAIPLLIRGRAKATTQIPFGPFLMAATFIIVLFGLNISNWYKGIFLLH